MIDQYCKPTFTRISEDKRSSLIAIAKKAFAETGYSATSVNTIADMAGISVGSIYKYFRSKQDLFLTVIEQGHDLVKAVVDRIVEGGGTVLEKVEKVLRAAVEYSLQDPEFVRIYIDCTTQGLAPLATRLSRSIESVAAEAYRRLIAEGQSTGQVDPGLDPDTTAFCLDNLFLMLQYTYGCGYYTERLAQFTRGSSVMDTEAVISGMLRFISNALSTRA